MPAVHCVSFLSCPMFESCAHLACIRLHYVRQNVCRCVALYIELSWGRHWLLPRYLEVPKITLY